jgi:hypothetical protein
MGDFEDGIFMVVVGFGAMGSLLTIIFCSIGIAKSTDNMTVWGWWAINMTVWVLFHATYLVVWYCLSVRRPGLGWGLRSTGLAFLIWVLVWSTIGIIYGGDGMIGLIAGFQIVYAGLSTLFVFMAMCMICCK